MRIKRGFVLRTVAGQNVVMPAGEMVKEFSGAIMLNETGAFIWSALESDDVTFDDVLNSMLSEFDVSEDRARTDLTKVVALLRQHGLLEE